MTQRITCQRRAYHDINSDTVTVLEIAHLPGEDQFPWELMRYDIGKPLADRPLREWQRGAILRCNTERIVRDRCKLEALSLRAEGYKPWQDELSAFRPTTFSPPDADAIMTMRDVGRAAENTASAFRDLAAQWTPPEKNAHDTIPSWWYRAIGMDEPMDRREWLEPPPEEPEEEPPEPELPPDMWDMLEV